LRYKQKINTFLYFVSTAFYGKKYHKVMQIPRSTTFKGLQPVPASNPPPDRSVPGTNPLREVAARREPAVSSLKEEEGEGQAIGVTITIIRTIIHTRIIGISYTNTVRS
jgi:hypothetical protein